MYANIIALLMDLAMQIVSRINDVRDAAKQADEWTPEQEAAFQKKKDEIFATSRWQPTD